jgi:hypothetical protein
MPIPRPENLIELSNKIYLHLLANRMIPALSPILYQHSNKRISIACFAYSSIPAVFCPPRTNCLYVAWESFNLATKFIEECLEPPLKQISMDKPIPFEIED